MKKNFYDILEVSKYASSEVIEKAYKTLVKKYHPDLQNDILKSEYEEKLKQINEAYDIISDPEKRKNYDLLLSSEEPPITFTNSSNSYDNSHKKSPYENPNDNANNISTNNANNILKKNEEYNNMIRNAVDRAYHDAYIQDLKNRGYKIKYKKTFNDYKKNFIAFCITLFILFILFQLPFVKNYLIKIYNENEALHYFVKLFSNTFK